MKKSRIFIASATVVLAVSAFFASKANTKRFVSFATAVTKAGHFVVKTALGANVFTTNPAAPSRITLVINGTAMTLYTKVNKVKIAYLK